jgi:hypothetical protein
MVCSVKQNASKILRNNQLLPHHVSQILIHITALFCRSFSRNKLNLAICNIGRRLNRGCNIRRRLNRGCKIGRRVIARRVIGRRVIGRCVIGRRSSDVSGDENRRRVLSLRLKKLVGSWL